MTFRRLLSASITTTTTTTSAADHFVHVLRSTPSLSALERALTRCSAAADSNSLNLATVASVLRRCSSDRVRALRFFVWAALLRRPSAAAFSAASSALDLPRHPDALPLLLDSYLSSPPCPPVSLSLPAFRILLSLCRHAALPDPALALLRRMPAYFACPPTPPPSTPSSPSSPTPAAAPPLPPSSTTWPPSAPAPTSPPSSPPPAPSAPPATSPPPSPSSPACAPTAAPPPSSSTPPCSTASAPPATPMGPRSSSPKWSSRTRACPPPCARRTS
ncbi:Pentatricopeptide repeat-containing protein [Ananas comosus]|uniref:Pentatricopeptide repeat-containing protein n=1 Tax=Ananas comosus TaxID=4615 RepID=A0A199VV04_ANACO|nr:Pentatricopeptide repeat-containing protein [Ananas comosus]